VPRTLIVAVGLLIRMSDLVASDLFTCARDLTLTRMPELAAREDVCLGDAGGRLAVSFTG
jgi:hypothetical protein